MALRDLHVGEESANRLGNSGVAGPREVSLDVFHLMGQRLALKGSFIAGLSDGSPKTAFGLGLVYWP